ncbi:LOW QUALITY PROTEIN: hypothetical protein SORBI_3004G103901 [Sorghum bicolor]|uniref:Berberine/berberine-like domain-containing protein n=1 Tax=Sorghum bicolor TaxID=4558 RepID=A0A1Z5RM73_SORBI|nr:LOW QUALITY PROTEIN: hypothetical protein SORBI_3004G103901 [Sorghum bicolor]
MHAIQQYYFMAVRKECDEDHASLLKTMTLRMSCNHISFANHSHTIGFLDSAAVPVPRIVFAFTVRRLVRHGDRRQPQATVRLLAKWLRVAHTLPDDLFVKAAMEPELDDASVRHLLVTFKSLFLGSNCNGTVAEMSTHLPELGVTAKDCRDMSWIQSMLYFYGCTSGQATAEGLLDRSLQPKDYYKFKLDYVTTPILVSVQAGLLARVVEDRGGSIDAHRRGYLYNVQYFVKWGGDANVSYEDAHLGWGVHRWMTPYATVSPRAAYVNFRDLDLGQNVDGETTYEAARAWGEMYFRGNFRRLAMVKAEVDPDQVFWSEQSIPPLFEVGEETGE